MSLGPLAPSKHLPILAIGRLTIPAAGVLGVPNPFPGRDITVTYAQATGTASIAQRAPKITHLVDAANSTITFYAWKYTATGDDTLVAATAAVDVDVQVIQQ